MHLEFQPAEWPGAWVAIGYAALALGVGSSALAQTGTPGVTAQDRQAIDRAEGEGDKVFKWILIHADKPRKSAVSKDDKSSVAAARPSAAARVVKIADSPKPTSHVEVESGPALEVVPEPNVASNAGSSAASSAAEATSSPRADAPSEKLPADNVVAVASPASVAVTLPLPLPLREPEPVAEEPLSETLMPLKRVDPKFPSNVLGAVRSGHVEVHFTVLPDGSVADAVANKSSNRRLIPYALDAVSQWTFAPLKRPQTAAVDLVFDLD